MHLHIYAQPGDDRIMEQFLKNFEISCFAMKNTLTFLEHGRLLAFPASVEFERNVFRPRESQMR